jgi:hypothetical protein
VGGDEAERPGGYAPVPAHQAVLAHGPLERRHPGDEQDHDQHEVGTAEPAQAASGDEQPARCGQRT